MLKIGIVGLPNVGKSTLFNALTRTRAAQAQNYPFCTIDPNVGIVEVPDERLKHLSQVYNSEKIIPAAIEFVDIAGLVKGASQGEGLGNKFLSHIRECDAIAHVIRGFEDKNITHVHGELNALMDKEVIESELLLADLQTLEKRLLKAASDAKSGDKIKKDYHDLLIKIKNLLERGIWVSSMSLDDDERRSLQDLHLITSKEQIYVINLPESDVNEEKINFYSSKLQIEPHKIVLVAARTEEDLIDFSDEEIKDYLSSVGIDTTGLENLITQAYRTLNLETYFTAGPKETRAWTIPKGTLAPQAAGVIHTDFEKGFIKAEVSHWRDFVTAGSHQKAKESGKMRLEGKDYVVRDGDVIIFKGDF